ncbi:GAF domain containing protein [Rhodotorula toruloides]|uniref:GAF domain containing protein n=1 Tax=Rhodotorula toruloides TaxID=5286 RepID=A0A511KPD9_RHOTO|nr:GAF domain containing protein [Rhodotorula toruloides]
MATRRPKTADSARVKKDGPLKKALGGFFGIASGPLYGPRDDVAAHIKAAEHRSATAASTSSFQTAQTIRSVETTKAPAVEPLTRRMKALDMARAGGRRAVAFLKRKLDSKTPVEELPKTWKEYEHLYANNAIDIEDPPLPPEREAPQGAGPTAFQQRFFPAPMPAYEALRQNVINRLDLFGTKAKAASASQTTLDIGTPAESVPMVPSASTASSVSRSSYLTTSEAPSSRRNSTGAFSTMSAATSATSALPTPGTPVDATTDVVESLENHPIFRSIIARCREVLNAEVGLLTILDEGSQLFLASGGLPDSVGDALPRSASFCGHTILNEDRGMVVLNAVDDWRFANNMITTHLGARFYAGVPVTVPTDDPTQPTVPIGSLCILDTKPRDEFSEAQRRVLRDLAKQASNAIEAWWNERLAAKMARLQGAFVAGSTARVTKPAILPPPGLAAISQAPRPSSASGFSTRSTTSLRQPKPPISLPATPPASIRQGEGRGHGRKDSDVDSTTSSIPASEIVAPRRPSALSLAVTTEDPISALPREVQKTFDTATKMLAKSLELELVYLAALDIALASSIDSSVSPLRILSSHGLPHPPPSFDPALHLKALRAPEGGLIYKNPRYSPSAAASYASGVMLPVLEVRRVGFVLCAYSRKAEREFTQRDLAFTVKFAQALETSCIKASRY